MPMILNRYLTVSLFFIAFLLIISCSQHFISIQAKNNIFIFIANDKPEKKLNTIKTIRIDSSKLKEELRFLIKLLPEDSYFNFLILDEGIKPWRLQLVEANNNNKSTASLTIDALEFNKNNLFLSKSLLDSIINITHSIIGGKPQLTEIFIFVDNQFYFFDNNKKFTDDELEKLKRMRIKINFVIYNPDFECDYCIALSKATGGKLIIRY